MRVHPDRSKPVLCVGAIVLGCVISLFGLATCVLAQTPTSSPKKTEQRSEPTYDIRGTVEVGVQLRNVQGGHTAKFQEVRDVPKGFYIQKLAVDISSVDSPYSFKLRGFEIGERDQRFSLEARQVGKYRGEFVWDQTPHYFGTGQTFLQQTAPGVFQVSPTLRAALQSLTLPDNVRTPANGPLANLVRQELRTTPKIEVRLRRDQAIIKQSFQITDRVELYSEASWLRTRGSRPMSVGTFVRRPAPGNGLADTGGLWEGIGQEFPEPIDHRTADLKIGANFGGDRWQAGVEYGLSIFRNRIGSITFENPFRVTDEQGCLPNPANPAAPTCGASNRFRQVRWQSDLYPNNDSHTITVWAKGDLTSRTQVRGIFSLAYWTQNDPFLPWTLNTAIVPRNWDGQSPVTDPTDVNQLPERSANAKMRNITQEYALVNRRETFRFQARYRSQSLSNETHEIIFPGYAAFGDSTWRAARTDFFNLPIENLDWDFRRQNGEAGFEWEILPNLTWKLDYGWEAWNRKNRDVNRNNDHSIRNRLDFEYNLSGKTSVTTHAAQPVSVTTLRLKLDYTYANRRALVYNTQPLTFCPGNNTVPPVPPTQQCPTPVGGAPASSPQGAWVVTSFTQMQNGIPIEFNLLRRYDENDRKRNDGRVTVELLRGPNTSFSASYRYLGDEHDKSFYGRLFNRSSFFVAEFSRVFESGAFVYANYSRDTNRYAYRDLAHLLPNPAAPPGAIVQGVLAQFPFANTWERTSRNSLDSFEFGVNLVPQRGRLQNWEFDLSYAFSSARDRINTVNPFVPRADSILHAGANPYPDTVVRRQNVNIAITRKISDKYEIGVRYWYEPYTQDDFSYNILGPYIHGNATSDLPKYLFLDARYGSYHANVATVFLRYRF